MEMVNDVCEILKVINEWREAAERENSYFAKFALEYFAFNSLLRLSFSSDNGSEPDRTLIERFKGWMKCKKRDFKNREALHDLIEIVRKRPLKNLTRNREIKIANEKDWNNIIETVYVIRNNLFHGHKQYSRERDEKLVTAGYKILTEFNRMLCEYLNHKEC